MRRVLLSLFLSLSLLLLAVGVSAQSRTPACSQSSGKANTLYCMPILSTENAYQVPAGQENFVVQSGFIPVTSAIGTQLSTLPAPTPASGLIFSFGPGGLTAERELGPIFSNAPWTVGRHRLYLAFAYQHFDFDKIDNVSFNNIPLALSACHDINSAACGPAVLTNSRYSVSLNEYISYVSFGLSDRVDVSVTIPIVNARTSITTTCSVCFEQLDYSDNGTPASMGFIPNAAKGNSSGIGDVIISFKVGIVKQEKLGFAVGIDVRTPTGNANNFLGAGTLGAHPYMTIGYRGRFSPHLNLGGIINGNSILASSDGTTPGQLPKSFDYSVGADYSVARWLSLSADLLGQTFFRAGTVAVDQNGVALHASTNQTVNTNTVALGFKSIPLKRLLISGNVLINVDNNSLHYKPSPMVGVSYTF
jgi:Putative MetA-pathway of phenol degradation